jgi:hypothetical protein
MRKRSPETERLLRGSAQFVDRPLAAEQRQILPDRPRDQPSEPAQAEPEFADLILILALQ